MSDLLQCKQMMLLMRLVWCPYYVFPHIFYAIFNFHKIYMLYTSNRFHDISNLHSISILFLSNFHSISIWVPLYNHVTVLVLVLVATFSDWLVEHSTKMVNMELKFNCIVYKKKILKDPSLYFNCIIGFYLIPYSLGISC